MKTGDHVKIRARPDIGQCKIVRFYANQGTALVEQNKTSKLFYLDYLRLEKDESR